MKRILAKCILAAFAAIALNAQVTIPPNMQPGDVLFVDPAATKAYIWLHAATGRMELLPDYTAEQAFRLLLDREQACWNIFNGYALTTQGYTVIATPAVPPKEKRTNKPN